LEKRQLKILMISSLPMDLSQIKGGVESAVINLLTGLSKLNIAVQVVNYSSSSNSKINTNFSKNIAIQYIPAGIIKNYIYDYLIRGRRSIKKIINTYQPDIIHVQGTGPQLLLLKYSKYKNIVVTQHGIMQEEKKYQIGLKDTLRFHVKSIIETIYLRKVENIIFISDYNKNLYKDANLKFTTNIYNAINSDFFHKNKSQKALNKILYVGAINKRKGLINVLKALNMLKLRGMYYKLEIIGDFTDKGYEDLIKNYLESSIIIDDIIFHGWQPPRNIIQIMQKNSLFILPSYQETLPVSIAEAMAAGLVVIANDVGGVSEMLIEKHSGFLYTNNNLEELIKILANLYNNPVLVNDISINAQLHAKKHFHHDVVALQTVEFYQKINDDFQSSN